MILSIANVLQPAELQSLQAALATAQFADGRGTASGAAARAKSNLQVVAQDPALDGAPGPGGSAGPAAAENSRAIDALVVRGLT